MLTKLFAGAATAVGVLCAVVPVHAADESFQRDFIAVMSPDQAQLAYYSYRDGASPEIYLLSLPDGSEKNLTNTDGVWEIEPAWSPDGKRIAFGKGTSMRDLQVFVMDIDDGSVTQLTGDGGSNSRPVYTPDGKYLLYHQRLDTEHAYIRRIDLASGENVRLTGDGLVSTSPFVSPDGSSVVFIGTDPVSEKADIYLMDIDGNDERRVLDSETNERSARFTPDGKHLLVAMQPDGENTGLYLVNLEAPAFEKLSHTDQAHSYSANFSPDGRTVFYDIGTWDGDFLIHRADFDYGPLDPVQVTGRMQGQ